MTVGGVLVVAEIAQHGEQRRPAPLIVDVIADAAGLEVTHHHLLGAGRMHEAAVQLRDRQQLLILDGHDDGRSEAVAPLRRDGGLFVHRQALGEPARHVGIGQRQSEHVAHLVPQGGGPMEAARRAAGRAVHGDERAVGGGGEGDAQRAQPGHAEGADGEVFVVGVNLHPHGLGELDPVLLLVSGDDALHFRFEVRTQQFRFLLVELQDDEAGLDGVEFLVAIEQLQRVAGGGVLEAVVVAGLELLDRPLDPGPGA